MADEPAPRRLLRKPQVQQVHPVSDKTRRAHEAAGLFPRRLRLEGTNIAVWDEAEILAWQRQSVKPWKLASADVA